jgi:D-alanyl-D-alanine carboxypeptidase (penicillin-binding protein 5/6)
VTLSARAHLVARVVCTVVAASLLAFPAPVALAAPGDLVDGVSVAEGSALAESSPGVTIPAGVLWTADGTRLWERNPDDERAMASTTKIMTALVVLERADLGAHVSVTPTAARTGEAGIDLDAGEVMTVEELLRAMLVRSANDAAVALAEHVAGDVETFVGMMNAKAGELGLRHTSFANPHGLDAPGHHTSAADLATMAQIALSDPRFAEIVAMPEVQVVYDDGTTEVFSNSNRLIASYSGATGVKTGWTNDAGYCVVVSATRHGVSLVAVVLGAKSEMDRFVQAEALLDWGFEHYRYQQVSMAGETVAVLPVTDYLDVTVRAEVAESLTLPVFDVRGPLTIDVDVIPDVSAPVLAGERVGTLTIVQGDDVLAQVPVVAEDAVPVPGQREAREIWFTRLWRSIFGGTLVAEPAFFM